MKRIAEYVIFLPVAVIVLLFAVANRHMVTVSFDPFNTAAPALSFQWPLFLVMFAVLMVGVVVGGAASWLRQGRHRRAARLARVEADRHRVEAERLRDQMSGVGQPQRQALPSPVPF